MMREGCSSAALLLILPLTLAGEAALKPMDPGLQVHYSAGQSSVGINSLTKIIFISDATW